MRTIARNAILPLVLLSMATGCVRQTTKEFVAADRTADEPVAEPREMRNIEVADDDSSDEGSDAAAVVARAPPAQGPDHALFRLGAGYGALGHIDLAPCRDHGLMPGYLHMHVTFRDNGHIVRAAVESLVAPPPEALDCVGAQLKGDMVPAFEGGDVTLAKSFFVN